MNIKIEYLTRFHFAGLQGEADSIYDEWNALLDDKAVKEMHEVLWAHLRDPQRMSAIKATGAINATAAYASSVWHSSMASHHLRIHTSVATHAAAHRA